MEQGRRVIEQIRQHSDAFHKYTEESRARVLPAREGLQVSLRQFQDFRHALHAMGDKLSNVTAQVEFKSLRQGTALVLEEKVSVTEVSHRCEAL